MTITTLLICLAALFALMTADYLAACAGAERWLSLREWLGLERCKHMRGRLVRGDGRPRYECASCGKHLWGRR